MDSDQPPSQDEIIRILKAFSIAFLKIYPRSFCSKDGLSYGLIRTLEGKKLVVLGEKGQVLLDDFKGVVHHQTSSLKVCDLSPENTEVLMTLFPYTKPVSLRKYPMTIGTGDCVGLATPGHIRAIKKFQIHPVLAHASAQENQYTGRNFREVIQDAAWAVFQENYQEGYGADGDHLKSLQEIKNALNAGFSMVTLDLSEKLNVEAFHYSKKSVHQKFKEEIDQGDAEVIFHLFLDKEFVMKGPEGQFSIRFDEERVERNTLLFYKALDFAEEVDQWIRWQTGNRPLVDFEICMDAMPFPTSAENHFFLALELSHRGIHIQSFAPRFIGEFQKGIDTSEEKEAFRRQFCQHVLIGRDYGNYKISIHSGSDKFSVFPDMEKLSEGHLHLKTVGTSWLEAIRLIALRNPPLYREMHRYALSRLQEASKLYQVTPDLTRIPNLEKLKDQELPLLLDQEDSRQLLHITCGVLLNAKNEVEKTLFKDNLYQILNQDEEAYWSLLEKHIEKHLNFLGVKKKKDRKGDGQNEKKEPN
jgi:hypothetical protein